MQVNLGEVVLFCEVDFVDICLFCQFNCLCLVSDVDGLLIWNNLLVDFCELILLVCFEVIVLFYLYFDLYLDYVCVQEVVCEVFQGLDWQLQVLLYYVNYLYDNDCWLMGDVYMGVSLLLLIEECLLLLLWMLVLECMCQVDKVMVLGMMYDL